MLQAYGFVQQSGPSLPYEPGAALAALALSAAHRTDRLVDTLHPYLVELSQTVRMGIAAVGVVQRTSGGSTPAAMAVSAPETRVSPTRSSSSSRP